MANNKKIIDQLPKINVSNAGDYLSNLLNAYNKYRVGREGRRDNFRQGVQSAADNIYQHLPENVQSGLTAAGNYIDKATGVGSVTEYLERVDDYMRNQILIPAANYADKIYGKIMENYQPESRMPNTEGISGITEPVQQKKSRSATSDYYTNVSNEINNQTIASQPKRKMMRAADDSATMVINENGGGSAVADESEGGAVPEVASSEGESKPFTVEDYNVWSKLQEQKQSIVDAYDANVDYAEEMKKSAYQRANDAYRIAAREAHSNYETNQPTYGLAAEQMYKSGLTGSGYSDYLAGKAMESRASEINAARSQQAAAQIAADQNYEKNMYDALSSKISGENAYLKLEKEYLAAYNAEISNAVQNIMDGIWDATIAENYLKRYAPDGAIDDETRAMIQNAVANRDDATYKNVTSALLEYLNAELKAGNPVSEESVRRWLVDNAPGITDDQINAYLSGYFKDGRLNTEAVINATNNSGTTTNPNNPGGTTTNPNNPGSGTGSQGGSGTTETYNQDALTKLLSWAGLPVGAIGAVIGSMGGTGKAQESLEEKTSEIKSYSYDETLDLFNDIVGDHKAKDADYYQQQIEYLGNENFNQDAAAKIKNMANGYVVSSGKFEGNKGARNGFENGDNFTVTFDNNSFRVESQGEADSQVNALAADLADGVVFGYGSELYIKAGDKAYKIGARPGVGNMDYNRLWRAVYQEQIAKIKGGVEGDLTNTGANTETTNALEKIQKAVEASQKFVETEQAKQNAEREANKAERRAEREANQAERKENWDNFVNALTAAEDVDQQVSSGINESVDQITGQSGGVFTGVKKMLEDAYDKRQEQMRENHARRAEKNQEFINNYNEFINKAYNDTQKAIDNALDMLSQLGGEKKDENEKNRIQKAIEHLKNMRLISATRRGEKKDPFEQEASITRGVANYEKDGMFDRNLEKGDNFTVEVAGKSYRVESNGEITNEAVINAAEDAEIHNGEVFLYGNELVVKKDDKYYKVGARNMLSLQDDKLKLAIEGNSANVPGDTAENYQQGVFMSKEKKKDVKVMDKLKLEDLDGNEYKLQVRAILGKDSAAYKAGNSVSEGEAYVYGNDIYVKEGEKTYKLAAVGGRKNSDYDKLTELLYKDSDPTSGTYKSKEVIATESGRIGNALIPHTNYTTDRHGNINPKKQVKVSINNNNYWVGTGEITTAGAYRVAKSQDAKVGEIYRWNNNLYMYLGDGAVKLEPIDLGPDSSYVGYDELMDYFES